MSEDASRSVGGRPRRDQRWALHAYACVDQVNGSAFRSYSTTVHSLGATILRSGLAAAMSDLERRRSTDGGKLLLEHLATANVSGLTGATPHDLPDRIRNLEVADYMLATREMLQALLWIKRAVEARKAAEAEGG